MTEPILTFQEIDFAYPAQNRDVLSGLTLSIQSGSIIAILGPNGAGKTTLLHTALGWLKPRRGQVLLNNQPLQTYNRREMGQWIGLVPQGEHIPFDYSVLDYVLFGRTPYLQPLELPSITDLQIAEQALVQVGMVHLENRSVANLSGGERQMILIARALAQQPRLLLLDEPTSHLDISNKSRLVALLRQLSADGVTCLFTTHEPDVAAAASDHLVLMRNGKILHMGVMADVLTSQNLTETYSTSVEVVEANGRKVVLWN